MPRPLICLAVALLAALPTGCGAGTDGAVAMPNYGSEDGLKIAQLVSEFNEAKAEPGKFKKMFDGTAPSNWREYEKHVYNVVIGSPRVDGATATASVTVHKESNYEVLATKDWTFTKVGDAWKIKTAPIQ